jgi:hypothetical protein
MNDKLHPTEQVTTLYDPLINPPPKGVSLLLINEGGVLIIGQWYEGALAWGYKPKIPQSVKIRDARQPAPTDQTPIRPEAQAT